MADIEFYIRYNNQDVRIDSLYERLGTGSSPRDDWYQGVDSGYYDKNFYYLKRNTTYHTLGIHIDCPQLNDYYAAENKTWPQPLLKGCCPCYSTASFTLSQTVESGWFINNRTLYDNHGVVKLTNLPRVIMVELVGPGGGGGAVNVSEYPGLEFLCGQGGGGGAYILAYIDTEYKTWHFLRGEGGAGGTYSGTAANNGSPGTSTAIWNDNNAVSETTWGSMDSTPVLIAHGGGGGRGCVDPDDKGSDNGGNITTGRAWSYIIEALGTFPAEDRRPKGHVIYQVKGSRGNAAGDTSNMQITPNIMADAYSISPYATFPGSNYPGPVTDPTLVVIAQGYASGHGGCSRLTVGKCNKWARVRYEQSINDYLIAKYTIPSDNTLGAGGRGGFALTTDITHTGEAFSRNGVSGDYGRIRIYY